MSHWKCPICWERNCDCKYEDVMAAFEKMEKAAKQATHLNAVYQIPLDKAPEMPELEVQAREILKEYWSRKMGGSL